MKISVLMCNYNYAAFIRKAIESVLTQTFSNFELIIVDDGSTDNSRDVINSFEDERIVRVFKENGGQASAFNAAFQRSSGELICLIDSDDWWFENKLETVAQWDSFLPADYSVLQHAVLNWLDGETVPYKRILPSGDCFGEMQSTGHYDYFVPTSGISFHRKCAEKVFPIPEALRICADAFLTRTLFTQGPVYSIPECLSYYRIHNNAVYRNAEFSCDKFFQEVLFPSLNHYYEQQQISYRFPLRKETAEVGGGSLRSLLRRFLQLKG